MTRARVTAALFGAVWLFPGTASADIAFPARLEVAEREPGVYAVTFTLPVIEGRKLRAEPRMPPSCHETAPRIEGASVGGVTSSWSVRCEPPSLAGEAILVEGLLGTQTDLAFTLTMLDGRSYSRILRPSRPGFLVPEPPAPGALALEALLAGMRRTIRHLSLWLLLIAAALLGARSRALALAALAFAAGHLTAQWLGGQGWLEVAPQMRDALTWATLALPALRLAGAGAGWKDWLQPLWVMALLLGSLFGGAQPEALVQDGLSNSELLLALALFSVGAALALLLMAAAAHELRAVLTLVGGDRWWQATTRTFAYVAGGLAVGMLLAQSIGWIVMTGGGPRAPLEFALLAAVLGPTLVLAGRPGVWTVLPFAGLAAVGMTLGLLRVPWSVSSLFALGTLLVLGSAFVVKRPLPARWAISLAVLAVPAHAWSTAQALAENVSRATAITSGAVLVAICVFFASLVAARDVGTGELPRSLRFMGATVALLAAGWRLGEYREWFEREVATEAALGVIRLPLLALALVASAALLWPRRRRVARELGVEQRSSGSHWLLLGAAFLVLPYGGIAASNPFFEPNAPRGEGARLVVSKVLSETYHAFNIEDEDALYDTLAQSVTGDLVDDLFLDSRRRLTAGTRAGTKVTVRDVSVLEIGEPLEGSRVEGGFAYDCRWVVVVRVRHLQHVHHRQNLYTGVLTLRPDDGRWKIARVELHSEDRAVVRWNPT